MHFPKTSLTAGMKFKKRISNPKLIEDSISKRKTNDRNLGHPPPLRKKMLVVNGLIQTKKKKLVKMKVRKVYLGFSRLSKDQKPLKMWRVVGRW